MCVAPLPHYPFVFVFALCGVVWCCVVLCCVVLCDVVLSCPMWCCLLLPCLVLSRLVLSYHVVSCLSLSCLVLSWLGLAWLVVSCRVFSLSLSLSLPLPLSLSLSLSSVLFAACISALEAFAKGAYLLSGGGGALIRGSMCASPGTGLAGARSETTFA